jgi:hypothetical protein
MRVWRRAAGAAGLAALLGFAAGCSNPRAAAVAAKNDSNIKKVTNLYTAFQAQHGWAGPKSEAEFQEFIRQGLPAENLQMMKVDPNHLEAIFVSERDSRPFKIKYGVGGGPGASAPVVFEQEGQGGRRQVGFTFGQFEEVDDARYQQLWDGKGAAVRPASPQTAAQGNRPRGRPPGAPPAKP